MKFSPRQYGYQNVLSIIRKGTRYATEGETMTALKFKIASRE